MQVPISGNTTHLNLPKKMLCLNIKTAQQIQAQCKLSVPRTLKTSQNEKTRIFYNHTSSKNVKSDFVLQPLLEYRLIKQHSTKVLSKQSNKST